MTGIASDVRLALRSLRRAPSIAALVVVTLGLGIAATTVIFSAVEGVLINPLRVEDADRYVSVYRGSREGSAFITPTQELAELWAEAESFEALEPVRWERPMLTGRGAAETVGAVRIRGGFHRLVELAPALGRAFTTEETSPGGADVVLLSWGFWRERFGGRPDVIGETLELDGRAHEIVGVMRRGFALPASLISDIALWLPYRVGEASGGPTLTGKLKEGVTRERAEAELATLMAGHPLASSWEARVLGVDAFIGDATRSSLKLLMAAVAVLLLIATLNVANLLLGRSQARMRETAVRAALGAGRGRIARQLLFESLMVGLAAGAAGVLLATWGLAALQALRPESLDVLDRVTLNGTVLAFATAVSLATSLLFGLAPALHAASADALGSLRSGQRLDTGTVRGRRFRLGLVVAEVSLSLVLLVGAGLVARTVASLYRVDPGFHAEGVIRADLELPRWKYEDPAAREALAQSIRVRLSAVPGVRAVVQSMGAPPRTGAFFGALEIEGRGPVAEEATVLYGTAAGPGHFALLGQRILDGRGFTEEEARSGEGYVLGRTAAARFWGDTSPVGSRIRLGEDEPWSPVVGVVEDVAMHGLVSTGGLQLYSPASPSTTRTWLVRAERAAPGVAAAVREAIHEVDLDLVVRVAPVADELRGSVGRQRFLMVLLAAFAAVAVVLAGVGFYGVLSHLVVQRRREIGIRMSLGAARRNVVGMVARQGAAATALGLLLGAPAAFLSSRIVASQLHGVGRGDVPTYLLAAAILLAAGTLASWLPARRAARVDPMTVMREE